MKAIHQWTVTIRPTEAGKARKITTIASLNGDGFSVQLPYHKARAGVLFKHPVIPGIAMPRFVGSETAVAFGAHDRVKLIYHADGFVEFSSNRPRRTFANKDIVSGEASGLGLFAAPLSRSIFSGPSVGINAFGIDQFEISEEQDELIVFEPSDFYYRNCTPETANSWMLAIYTFPRGVIPPIRIKGKRSMLTATLEPLNGPIGAVVELVAISLPQEKMFLGLCVNCFSGQHKADSGWLFSGPGDYTAERRGHVLMGIYPLTEISGDSQTALRQEPETPQVDTAHFSPRESTQRASPPRRSKRNRKRK
jgi:hypothetical protein